MQQTGKADPARSASADRAAHRKDGQGTIRAATPPLLLDAIKDDAGTRPFTSGDTA